ncbi:hypothetical protein O181_065642 [Austropuccinia psidii MF-1]|uniref:Uncharacterized protein n=1 Tax=Austropuccinia psidii MF-1 TaxID=1389203 RepID=A0A9Q3I3G9_9BASI|nr:hypothetical protein [Austropuccinia psidii MF-1]
MRPKGARWAYLRQFWPQTPTNAELAKTTLGPKIGQEPQNGCSQPPEATSSPPSKNSPSFRGRPFLPQCTPYSRIQEWCIYGIIYHYAPFFLGNPMMTFSGPNYVIPNKVPNPLPILKEDVSAIQFGNSLAATRRPFKDPNHLALQELGCQFSSGLF